MRIFWKIPILALPDLIFSGFYIKIISDSDGFIASRTNEIEEKKTMFIQTNQPLITSFYIKKVPILPN